MVSKFLKSKTGHKKRKSTQADLILRWNKRGATQIFPEKLFNINKLTWINIPEENKSRERFSEMEVQIKILMRGDNSFAQGNLSLGNRNDVQNLSKLSTSSSSRVYQTYLSVCLVSKGIKNLFHSDNFPCSSIYSFPDDSISL